MVALWICLLLAAVAAATDTSNTCNDADDASSCANSSGDFVAPAVRQWIEQLPTENSLYLDGAWVKPNSDLSCKDDNKIDVVDPSTGQKIADVAVSNKLDVDMAVAAARRALDEWSLETTLHKRRYLISRLLMQYSQHAEQLAHLISHEMGAPIDFAMDAQVASGIDVMQDFLHHVGDEGEFKNNAYQVSEDEDTVIIHQAIGVVALITPWNWPMHQIILKVVPALLVGCTVILKPSEQSPLSALLFGQLIDEAGFPPGVFQLVNGYGPNHAGEWLASHPDVDMVSFTGSTRGGTQVSLAAAPTLKRVSLEMGGKGANIIFEDLVEDDDLTDFREAVQHGVQQVMSNSGQSCDAPTRVLVPEEYYKFALWAAKEAAARTRVGSAHLKGTHIGPVVSEAQYERIQTLIQSGIDQGATLLVGGLGKPTVDGSGSAMQRQLQEHYQNGWYVQPTIFADCTPEMTIWQEEIFGPVLCISKFASEDEAIRLANNSPYGLTHYAHTYDKDRRLRLALELQSGMVVMNGVELAMGSPFGGVKQSGNSREGGIEGLKDFCIVKAVSGLNSDDEDSEDDTEDDLQIE